MTKSFLCLVISLTLLLTGCGGSGKSSNDNSDSTKQNTDRRSGKQEPTQLLAKRWKELAEEMYPASDTTKGYDAYELKELKRASNNSFYEFKIDGSYIISRPDEEPGKGRWELSKDAKTLTLRPSKGNVDVLEVQMLNASKVKLKIKEDKDTPILVLIPAS